MLTITRFFVSKFKIFNYPKKTKHSNPCYKNALPIIWLKKTMLPYLKRGFCTFAPNYNYEIFTLQIQEIFLGTILIFCYYNFIVLFCIKT